MSGGDERSYSRNGKSAETGQQSECAADDSAGNNACGSSLGRLGVFLVGNDEISRVVKMAARRALRAGSAKRAAQTALLANQRSAVTLQERRMGASVQLIQALGGGWNRNPMKS
jgi:hypothetical protein